MTIPFRAITGRTQRVTSSCCVITGVYSPQRSQRTQRGSGEKQCCSSENCFLRIPSVFSVTSVVNTRVP
jgi:hypothetical protein